MLGVAHRDGGAMLRAKLRASLMRTPMKGRHVMKKKNEDEGGVVSGSEQPKARPEAGVEMTREDLERLAVVGAGAPVTQHGELPG
jgi:hypothetical protein